MAQAAAAGYWWGPRAASWALALAGALAALPPGVGGMLPPLQPRLARAAAAAGAGGAAGPARAGGARASSLRWGAWASSPLRAAPLRKGLLAQLLGEKLPAARREVLLQPRRAPQLPQEKRRAWPLSCLESARSEVLLVPLAVEHHLLRARRRQPPSRAVPQAAGARRRGAPRAELNSWTWPEAAPAGRRLEACSGCPMACLRAASHSACPRPAVAARPRAVEEQLQLHPGAMLEIVRCDSWCQPGETAEPRMSGAWPADGAGQFVEATVDACSQAYFLPVLQGLFARGASVPHLCAQAFETCHLSTTLAIRSVVHSDMMRVKAVPEQTVPQLARAPQEASLAVQLLPMELTAEAAARRLRSSPGAPMAADLKQTREFLAQRGGAADYNVLNSQSANVAQYDTRVRHEARLQSETGGRHVHGMRMIGECLGTLTRGELPRLGETLMQRLNASGQATKGGYWQ
ncbi:unnamed protein product, partial [Prorocentrum cordatum]